MPDRIDREDLRTLASFRRELRSFLSFSEGAALSQGLAPQQHQAILAIAGSEHQALTVGELAETLLLRPHSASGLVTRLEKLGMVERRETASDGRQRLVRLTNEGAAKLAALSSAHRAELRRLRPMLTRLLEALE
ncbi:MarR family winged helix-turn-helix transcriptional regulator [Amaricoccus solimangrovi]|uniref:MarR family transcriptional regulator n=1 Tax=Amaricoccus solimangrovi TaxID=2589815 RepID=A0A501WGB2_9RHOB|nr:helix-turn-helix domain-containing protein [Amaricoccus solimangrovi]TPE44586.1 MarR family transcriptional regulator [Amaricoccus solimangrovi]